MKLRIFFRAGNADYDGKFVGWSYASDVIELPNDSPIFQLHSTPNPEVIGGEWLMVIKDETGGKP